MHNHFCNLEGCEVAQTELDELALLVQVVQLLQGVLEWCPSISSMKVEDVNTISAQLLERFVQLLLDDLSLVSTRLVRIPFGGQGESSILPLGITSPGFLLAANVDTCCIDLVIACGLEAIQALVVVFE